MQSSLAVTTPAASQDLISLYTVRSELDIQFDIYDLRLSRWISEASARISDFCGRSFRKETLTETFWSDSCAAQPAILTRAPIVSVTSVTDNGEALTTDSYRLRGQRLWRMSGGSQISFSSSGEVVIVYVAGYDLVTDIPGVLQRYCLSLIKNNWTTMMRDSALKRESVEIPGVETIMNEYFDRGDTTTNVNSALPYDMQLGLVNFMDIVV